MFEITFLSVGRPSFTPYLFDFLDAVHIEGHVVTCRKCKSKLIGNGDSGDRVRVDGEMIYAEQMTRPLFVKAKIKPHVYVNLLNEATYFLCEVHSTQQY